MPDGQSIVVQARTSPHPIFFTDGLYSIWLRGGMDELRAPHGPIKRFENLARRQAGQLCSGARRRPYSP